MEVRYRNNHVADVKDDVADVYVRKGRARAFLSTPPADLEMAQAQKLPPVEKTETEGIRQRISQLEAEASEKSKEIESLRAELSDSLAGGTDASSVKKKLASARSDLENTIDALKLLDERLVEVSQREREEAVEALKVTVENRYRELVQETRKAVENMNAKLSKVLGEHAEGVPERLNEVLRDACWTAANKSFSEDYLRHVPSVAKTVPRRGDTGQVEAEPIKRTLA